MVRVMPAFTWFACKYLVFLPIHCVLLKGVSAFFYFFYGAYLACKAVLSIRMPGFHVHCYAQPRAGYWLLWSSTGSHWFYTRWSMQDFSLYNLPLQGTYDGVATEAALLRDLFPHAFMELWIAASYPQEGEEEAIDIYLRHSPHADAWWHYRTASTGDPRDWWSISSSDLLFVGIKAYSPSAEDDWLFLEGDS